MKFEKFLKSVGVYGVIVDCGTFGQFLQSGRVMLQIPDGVNVLAAYKRKAQPFEIEIFERFADDNKFSAQLTAAKLPTPDAKATQIERIFSDVDGGEISIDNKTFGMIEKNDSAYIVDDEETGEIAALVITSGFGDAETIKGVIFDADYYNKHSEV